MARQLLQTSLDRRNSVRELLQIIFSTELLSPSKCLWIVSPWIRDIPILDNATGGFATLSPDFPRSEVRLSRVLLELLGRGTRVVIVTRPEPDNMQIVDALGQVVELDKAGEQLTFQQRGDLHAKGIVSDHCSLIGSMNFTYKGLDHSTELLIFDTDASAVEQSRISFFGEYGGQL